MTSVVVVPGQMAEEYVKLTTQFHDTMHLLREGKECVGLQKAVECNVKQLSFKDGQSYLGGDILNKCQIIAGLLSVKD